MESGNSKEDDYSSLPRENFAGDEYLYQCNGFWFTKHVLPSIQQVPNLFKPRPTDVLLASFPKTGTTWLKALVYSIINRSSRNLVRDYHAQMLVPFVEIHLYGPEPTSLDAFPSTNSKSSACRTFATHLPFQFLANSINSSDCRVVYVTRNPKDTLVSLWKFINKSQAFGPWPWEAAQENFCNGTVISGPYYDHVIGYWKESLKRPKKVFFITYEELKSDCKNHVKRLAEFLGCPFDDNEDDIVEEIVRNCSYERLSNYEVNKSNDLIGKLFPSSDFFRKGEVGDHKNYLNEEMIERIDTITREKFHASGFMYGI